ncbi:armadillo-type protein [Bipolaris maydis]|nr:armadillo-type protein [Bipolaris maydis]
MAPRSRRSAAAATEAVQEEEQQEEEQQQEGQEQHGLKKLRFKQPLVGRPGKPVGVSDLLTRLKALLDELRTIDQEEAHRDSLMPVAESLAHHSLLQHKDNGVRAWTVCCIVDMLKLFAPDAPYPASKLKEIFSVIIHKLLPLLADPSHPYNSQHMYILRSLAEWKSILLINEIPGSDQLTSALFTTCFDVLSGPSKAEDLSKNIEHNMTEVLSTIIDEAPSVTHDVVDVIVAQFLWADPITLGASKGKKSIQVDAKQSTLRRKEAPPAYNMAKNVCNSFPDKMARLIGNYFSSVIVDFTNSGTMYKAHDADDDLPKGPSEEDLNEAHKAHRLLRELWKCCPGVLQDIIPHLQDELATENVQLRQLATETFGDMISGIGAAGPPPLPDLDPVAYPSQSLSRTETARPFDYLTTPVSINSFPTQYPVAYHSFLQRKNDKSAVIRASWTTGIGRILMTSAGGIGLDLEEEQKLLKHFAECLIDSDEKVRLAAVKAVAHFEFNDIVRKLGSNGGMAETGSILSNLADRVKDKKSVIHSESMKLLGRIWGVAAGAIAEGDETIKSLLGPIPSRILEACYVNDLEINVQVDLALYDSLLPLGYPPLKAKAAPNSQVVKDSQTANEQNYTEADLDKIRTERQLVLVNGLEEKAKKVFFAKQGNQGPGAKYMEHFLKLCEEYNGGVTDKSGKDVTANLEGLITYYAKTLPDSTRVRDDLWKFAKTHDRRAYALIRFCMDPASDYRKVYRSIKELRKRIEDGPGASLLDTLTPLLYRVSLLCYNKSHVPAVIEFTRTDNKGLGATAHELLKEISTKHPKRSTNGDQAESSWCCGRPQGLCRICKEVSNRYSMNGKDSRKLVQSFLNFAFYGTPPQAAKHAITIIMNSDDKKEMHAKEILTKSIKGFEYGGAHWLTKLAALSQLVLLAQSDCEDEMDAVIEVAIQEVLQNHTQHPPRLMLNGWTHPMPIFKNNGEGSTDDSTPAAHKSRQRLLAANSLLKLSCHKRLDPFLTPANFVQLALVTHDPCTQVRKGFADKLMKYLGQGRLPPRFYTILFFLAHDPDKNIKNGTMTWIRARRAAFAARKETVLESVFARLLSLLAHHPDFDTEDDTLKLMSEYILYYLKCVATEEICLSSSMLLNVSKALQTEFRLHDRLMRICTFFLIWPQALIRSWEEQNNWAMQLYPGKMKLPSGIFRPLESHERAQEIAMKTWIGEDLVDELDPLASEGAEKPRKKAKGDRPIKEKKAKADRPVKTPKKKRRSGDDDDASDVDGGVAPSSGPRRKSDRRSTVHKSYVEVSSDDEDAEAGTGEAEEEDVDASEDEEAEDKSSPAPEEDVEMADTETPAEQEAEVTAEASEPSSEAEPEPEPAPVRKSARGKAADKTNGVKSSPVQKRKVAEPAKEDTPPNQRKAQQKPEQREPRQMELQRQSRQAQLPMARPLCGAAVALVPKIPLHLCLFLASVISKTVPFLAQNGVSRLIFVSLCC